MRQPDGSPEGRVPLAGRGAEPRGSRRGGGAPEGLRPRPPEPRTGCHKRLDGGWGHVGLHRGGSGMPGAAGGRGPGRRGAVARQDARRVGGAGEPRAAGWQRADHRWRARAVRWHRVRRARARALDGREQLLPADPAGSGRLAGRDGRCRHLRPDRHRLPRPRGDHLSRWRALCQLHHGEPAPGVR